MVFLSCLGGSKEAASMHTQQKRRLLLIMNWKRSFLARWGNPCWVKGNSVKKCKPTYTVQIVVQHSIFMLNILIIFGFDQSLKDSKVRFYPETWRGTFVKSISKTLNTRSMRLLLPPCMMRYLLPSYDKQPTSYNIVL